jgi:3-methyladenine DNA glycosylase AlkD
MVAAMVGESALVTRAQMNAWAADFDSWGICDTVCFHLFDRAPFAWEKAHQWATSPREFVKRAAFSIMAGLVLHDKDAPDAKFLALFPLIEQGAEDDRNFVKKGVNWALRTIGKRNVALNAAAIATARRLAARDDASCRWVGKHALRELTSPAVQARLVKRAKGSARKGSARKGSARKGTKRAAR